MSYVIWPSSISFNSSMYNHRASFNRWNDDLLGSNSRFHHMVFPSIYNQSLFYVILVACHADPHCLISLTLNLYGNKIWDEWDRKAKIEVFRESCFNVCCTLGRIGNECLDKNVFSCILVLTHYFHFNGYISIML